MIFIFNYQGFIIAELTLFLSAFLAATILPFSSEVVFLTAISNDMKFFDAMIYASSGNILAIVINYFLGKLLYLKTKSKLKTSRIGRISLYYGYKWRYYSLPFTWLPIIGDPLTLVAGIVRLNFLWFFIVSAFLRIGRYYILGTI